ncbi:MAG: phospholipid carrier-dependent glycosyltransferase [Spirochaetales bacterium]|nr:phospholipid carrier-dependent glycosyltransferase [Spirochaetales bacterium]
MNLLPKVRNMLFSDKKHVTAGFALVILIISFFTFFVGYERPAALFWDENYHIPSAEKYIQGKMFMECHPPLGKLLIAFGEVLLSPNKTIDKSALAQTDYTASVPGNLSFAGYRFFPVLFAMSGAVFFFLILFFISKNNILSFAGSFLYLFDNALIVHFRGAMLDGIQLFFILAAIVCFLYSLQTEKKLKWVNYAVMGIFTGLAISVKLNSAIIIPLFVFLFGYEYRTKLHELYQHLFIDKSIKKAFGKFFFLCRKSLIRIAQSVPAVIVVFLLVFFIHTSLGQTLLPGNTYKASPAYKEAVAKKEPLSLLNFPVMLFDNLYYISTYHEGVPKLDGTNPNENGSHPFSWPLGGKTINYRWEKSAGTVKYLYLAGNPVIWTVGLVGLLLGFILVAGKFIFKTPITHRKLFFLISVFLFLYISYMAAMAGIDRVMYLYHYLIPLQFSTILSFLIFFYIYRENIKEKNLKVFVSIILICFMIVKTFLFFSPLTYYKGLTTTQFKAREWSEYWRMKHVE